MTILTDIANLRRMDEFLINTLSIVYSQEELDKHLEVLQKQLNLDTKKEVALILSVSVHYYILSLMYILFFFISFYFLLDYFARQAIRKQVPRIQQRKSVNMDDKEWVKYRDCVTKYIQKYNQMPLDSYDYIKKEDRNVVSWVQDQRMAYYYGVLDQKRVDSLESIDGWGW